MTMNTIRSLLMKMRYLLVGAGEVVRYVPIFLWGIVCPKAIRAARFLAAKSQLVACRQQIASQRELPNNSLHSPQRLPLIPRLVVAHFQAGVNGPHRPD